MQRLFRLLTLGDVRLSARRFRSFTFGDVASKAPGVEKFTALPDSTRVHQHNLDRPVLTQQLYFVIMNVLTAPETAKNVFKHLLFYIEFGSVVPDKLVL